MSRHDAERLDDIIADLQTQLPPGNKLHPDVFRQSDFIEVAVHNVEMALAEGVVLVIIVVLLFLANVRATLITITAIPLSLVVAIFAMKLLNITINTMTLGGMAIAIGALVDDAIIDNARAIELYRGAFADFVSGGIPESLPAPELPRSRSAGPRRRTRPSRPWRRR